MDLQGQGVLIENKSNSPVKFFHNLFIHLPFTSSFKTSCFPVDAHNSFNPSRLLLNYLSEGDHARCS